MTTPSPPLDVQALLSQRDARLDAALALWRDGASEDPLLTEMQTMCERLGLGGVLARLGELGDSRAPAGVILLASRLIEGDSSFEDTLAALRAPAFSDQSRAVAVLFASADHGMVEQATDLAVLRLVGETADDEELAARSYFRLGERSGFDNMSAANAFRRALDIALGTDLRGLQADCLIALARCALRADQPAAAADHAELAKELYRKEGHHAHADEAAIVEAVARLETGDPVGAAAAARPVVRRQVKEGVGAGERDAGTVLRECIRRVAQQALQEALTGDEGAVGTYEAALRLAGDSGYRYPDEAADRILIGQCLIRGDHSAAGAGQLALAVEIARTHHLPYVLLTALTALSDALVSMQAPEAIARTTEALGLARAAPDPASLPDVLALHAAALRQNGRSEEALEAYAEANARGFRMAHRVNTIMTLLEFGRETEAGVAIRELCDAIQEHGPANVGGDEAHVAILLQTLVTKGYPGLAERLQHILGAEGAQLPGSGIGSERDRFVRSARQTMAEASVALAAGTYDAVIDAVTPVMEEARSWSDRAVELPAAYLLGEACLMARRFDEARAHLEMVVGQAEAVLPQLHAAALNKLGSVHSVGFKDFEVALDYQERALQRQRDLGEFGGVVVTLVGAAQTCVELGRLEEAEAYSEELSELGPKYPPPDVEWITYVPALVDAHRHRWDRAKPAFRETITELERKRRQFRSAAAERQWCEAKAFMYGNAVEGAIVADDCGEAITYLELARNRYLDRVAREHGVPGKTGRGVAEASLDVDGFLGPPSLDSIVASDAALVWCGGFPRGLGVVAAWRESDGVALASSFHPDLNEKDMAGLFQGDISTVLTTHRAGRSVELVAEMVKTNRDLDLGANPYWQGRGGAWNQSLAHVVDLVAREIWPKILATIGRSVPNVVLLPSIGCGELPLCAAAPERWPDGSPLAASVAPGVDALPSLPRAAIADEPQLAQVVNPSEDPSLVCCPIEADAVRRLFETERTTLRGRRANIERVAEAIRGATVFHFIGHAFYDWQDPLDSGLVCATRRDGTSVLTVRELFARVGVIATPLIVLSACQIGNVQAGDKQNDFINLPSALVAAGARAVIAPRWLVDDVAASMLFANLFQRWRADRVPVGAALAAARRWLRDDVTRLDVDRWLARTDATVDGRRIESLRRRYAETYGETDRPFQDVAHWGAFELTGDTDPFGALHA